MDEFNYPLLFICESQNLIVKFTSMNTGEVLQVGNSRYSLGEVFSNFTSHNYKNVWKPYKPKVTLNLKEIYDTY